MEGKRSGEFIGAFPSYGYIKDPNDTHKLIIDEEAARIVKKIFEWKVNDGMGNLSICHKLNEMGILNPTGYKRKMLNQNYNNSKILQEDYSWCPSTVRNILKNDVYIGNITQGKRKVKSYKIHKVEQVPKEQWITVKNMHEAIIDEELFYKAQSLNKVDTRVQNNGVLSIWAGILKCADCGRAMHKKYCMNKNGKRYEYYICGTYRKKSKQLCTKHTIKEEILEEIVLQTIKLHIDLLVDVNKILEDNINKKMEEVENEKIEKIKKTKKGEVEKVKELKKGLYEDWKNDYITKDEYVEYKKKYEKEIEKINGILNNLDKQENKKENIRILNKKWIENFEISGNINKLDRDIIMELIDFIEIYENKKITIHFKFMDEINEFIDDEKNKKEIDLIKKVNLSAVC